MQTRIGIVGGCLILGVLGICILPGCPAPNTGSGQPGPGAGPGTDIDGTLSGQVSTLAGKPIAGVAVTLSTGQSSSTDGNGFYSFGGLSSGARIVAKFRASGFAASSKALTVGTTPGCIFLAQSAQTVTISADTDSTQRSGNSSVTLESGSLVDGDGNPVSGDVELTATFIDPSTNNIMAFPGSFQDAQTTNGSETTLESFGFAIYELMQDGEPVNLAGGMTADIEYILPENSQDKFNFGDTIPLWEFDDDTAMWTEAGEGEIQPASDGSGRLAWFAKVNHFSAWNCDAPIAEKNCITGRVVVGGSPVNGAEVSAIGLDYNGTSTARSSSDGSFCVEVKIGSTVRLELRLNGAAQPLVTQEVTVANNPADCTTGGCTIVADLSVSLDACVSGQVLESDGTPAAGVTVFVVPGGTTTTDNEGFYCAAAVANREVFVFAQGRPSIAVQTSANGSCNTDSCASADLKLASLNDGDEIGTLSAQTITVFGIIGGGVETFSISGSFLVADEERLSELEMGGTGNLCADPLVEQIAGCTVTTSIIDISVGTGNEPEFAACFDGISALDPGEPGLATSGTVSVNLLRGDPSSIVPPASFLAGIFSPVEDSEALKALGFDNGQSIDFSFPGGTDIGAFNATVKVPDVLIVTSPDLSDPNLSVNRSQPLGLEWVPGNATDIVVFIIQSSSSDTMFNSDGSIASTTLTVSAFCEFPDTGSATVAVDVMSQLPDAGMTSTTILSLSRQNENTISVPLIRVTGNGTLGLRGSAGVSRAIIDTMIAPDIPDLPDLCSFITCPEGQTCNPTTLQCEPS